MGTDGGHAPARVGTGTPLVSVVVPTHNRSGLLTQTLRSVLWQRGVDLEVVVVDDGSTDDTAEVVAALDDPRVRLLRHGIPRGVSAARNRGVAAAGGRWLAFCDDDDLWAPDKLARQLAAAQATGRSWVYAGEVHIDLGRQVVGGAPPLPPEGLLARLPHANVVPGGCSGVLLRRDALCGQEPFDGRRYRHFADWDLWLRLARQGPPAWVPSPLVGYRIHPGNASLDTAGMVAELAVIEHRHGVRVDRTSFYRYAALISRRAGRRRAALGYYLHAALRDPAYLATGLPADVGDVARGVVRALWRASPRRPPWRAGAPQHPPGTEGDREWLEQGGHWLRQLPS
jgi:glycosyltransferase involved in cell wall biosynthesis